MENEASQALPWWFKPCFFLILSFAIDIAYRFLGQVPWELGYPMALASALSLCVAFLLIPKRILAFHGPTPNQITLIGLAFWSVAIVCYVLHVDLMETIKLFGIGGVLDVLDGKKAVAMKEFGVPRSAAEKRRGKSLDPFADKLKNLTVIVLFGLQGVINFHLTIAIVSFDTFGSLIRNPVNIGARMYWAAKKMKEPGWKKSILNFVGRRMVRKTKASGFGKVKSTIQSLGLLVCAPYDLKWCAIQSLGLLCVPFGLMDGCAVLPSLPNLVYWFALAFGIMSIVSRMRIHPAFDRLVDRIGNAGSIFKHRDLKFSDLIALLKDLITFIKRQAAL